MWHFLTLMLEMVHGEHNSVDPGFGYEYYAYIVEVVENFASKDSTTFLGTRPPECVGTYAELTLSLVERVLYLNNDGFNQFTRTDGIYTMRLIRALLENMSCDVQMPKIIEFLCEQINMCTGKPADEEESPTDYTVSVFVTLLMCFFNNPTLSLELIYK
jgi:hypothetical protein